MREVRMFEAFAGYGSQLMAMRRLEEKYPNEFKVIPVGISEIDKYAIEAYKAVHGETKNYGDISKINWDEVPDFDLFTYSFPCTDLSNAGLQKGFTEGSGTRSSLLWECRRAIVTKKPKYLMMENVAALVSQKFISTFNQWQLELENYGYTNFSQVLNAKDYGVPQNRERIFMISILDCEESYYFPKKMKLTKRLKDVLEDNVDEKYYLSDKMLEGFMTHNEKHQAKGTGFLFEPTDGGDCEMLESKCCASTDRQCDNRHETDWGGQNDPVVLGWTRDHKGNIIDRHPVEVANCVTAAKRDNTSNYVVEHNEPINVDEEGNAKRLRAGYYKAGAANFKKREDGFAQTAVKVKE